MRRPRGAYGWVDMRAVTEGHLERLGTQTALTYLFLCTVGDTAGLSFWSHERMARILGLDRRAVQAAIDTLVATDLIACQGQIVQVLPLVSGTEPKPVLPATPTGGPSTRPVVPVEANGRDDMEEHRQPDLPLADAEVRTFLPQALAQLARVYGHSRRPADSLALSVARSLAIKDRRERHG